MYGHGGLEYFSMHVSPIQVKSRRRVYVDSSPEQKDSSYFYRLSSYCNTIASTRVGWCCSWNWLQLCTGTAIYRSSLGLASAAWTDWNVELCSVCLCVCLWFTWNARWGNSVGSRCSRSKVCPLVQRCGSSTGTPSPSRSQRIWLSGRWSSSKILRQCCSHLWTEHQRWYTNMSMSIKNNNNNIWHTKKKMHQGTGSALA